MRHPEQPRRRDNRIGIVATRRRRRGTRVTRNGADRLQEVSTRVVGPQGGNDVAAIVSGRFDESKLAAATKTNRGAAITKTMYAGTATYAVGQGVYVVLTGKTIVAGNPETVHRVLDRIHDGLHAGSRAVREFIERVQPAHFFCGHIHEAEGVVIQIGATRAMNVGKKGYLLEI